jgi:TRAP-type transport system periplasmic protein
MKYLRIISVFSLIFSILYMTPSQAGVVLKIATIAPDGSMWMKRMRDGAAQVDKATSGRVRFKFYTGGVMGDDQSVLRKIRIGQLHGGAVTGGSLSKIFPDMQVYSLPFLFDSLAEVDRVRKEMDEHLIKGLEKKGYIAFGLAEGGFAYLMSNDPVRSIEDMRKSKIWSPTGDEISRAVLKVAEVTPIPLPLPDVLTGLQTRLIDTIATSLVAAVSLQWHTKIKYVTDTPLSYIIAMMIVEQRAFNKISPADQKRVRDIMREIFIAIGHDNRRDNASARSALLKQGIKFVKPSTDEVTQWKNIAAKATDDLIASGNYNKSFVSDVQSKIKIIRNQH